MQSLAAARRPKAKVVKPTHDSDEDANGVEDVTSTTESIDLEPSVVPAIRRLNRPALGKKSSGSKLKLSFGGDDENAEGEEETFVPKRSMLSKKASESKGPRKFGLQVDSMPTPPIETVSSRPNYTKDYLSQLRDSTPSTPKDISRYLSEDDSFPESLDSLSHDPAVPSARPAEILDEAVIRALKERRRDRATYGDDYLSLDNAPKSSRRAQSDDEETYLKYVHEPVRLQKDMEAAQKAHKKSQIQEALNRGDSDSEAMSEVSSDEWENQQIAKAAPSLVKTQKRDIHAIPEEILPIPTVQGALARLRGQVEEMKRRRNEIKGVMEELERQRGEIMDREEFVQESLAKAGKEYEMLNEEFKSSGVNRGLDEVGDFGTPIAT